jgi:malate dehydrogenase (oxaloacetate-decarboxylating)(NADP+)
LPLAFSTLANILGSLLRIKDSFFSVLEVQVKIEFERLILSAIGVADSIVSVMQDTGMSNLEARRRFWLVDSKGLVTTTRGDTLQSHKIPYAR